jgi:hypothetical protein
MAAVNAHQWSLIRKRVLELVQENPSLADPQSQEAAQMAFEDPAIQKHLQRLINAQGPEQAFDVFAHKFSSLITDFIDSGIIAEDELVPANSGMAG